MTKLICIKSTEDGRLTAYKTYYGQIITYDRTQVRFACFDNKRQWTTFNLDVFVPLEVF